MKIMTQKADLLSEQIQAEALAQELMDQQITLLTLKETPRPAVELLARSLEKLGERCSWIWFSNDSESGPGQTGTAFLSLGRDIRCVDRFPLNKAGKGERQPVHMAVGVQMEGMEDWFYCLSQNPTENNQEQWKLLNGCIVGKRLCSTVWLLGMQAYGVEIGSGSWTPAADGTVWCSRRQDIKKYNDQPPLCENGAVVFEVKE